MSTRVSPLERIRAQIDDLFATDRDLGDVLEEVARLGVRLLMQTAVEAEVSEFLGRERYSHHKAPARGAATDTARPPSRPVDPRRRGHPRRGLGSEATLSKSTVSRICSAVKEEFDSWKHRPLGDVSLEYLFLDGSHFRYHDGARAEPVLAAWGMTTEGKPVLIGLEPGASESTDAWGGFLDRLVARGLRPPLLVISDGAPGLIAATELVFSQSLRQRCVIHRSRNLLSKVPMHAQAEVKAAYWKIFDDIDAPPGEDAVAVARNRAASFSSRYERLYPSAVAALNHDLASLLTHLRFPAEHHSRIRHSNFIERTFGETRRRVKVIGRLPGERSCLSLVWAVLDRASRGWRGVVMTPATVRQLQELRRQLFNPPSAEEALPEDPETVIAAA